MTTNEGLTTRLAAQAQGVEPQQQGRTVADLLEMQKTEIARALPRHFSADRFARIALTECRRNPRLMACTPASLLGALMQAAQIGLEPGPLGQAYLVPFKDEVTFIVGYRGYIDLYRRSGEGSTIVAREVRQNDYFSLRYTNQADELEHIPELEGDRGPVIAYYGVARFKDGWQLVHVMTQAEVDKHRNRSRAKDSGPWVTDPEAMGRKTVIRAMSPYLPVSAEVALALESDENVYTWNGGSARAVDTPALPAADVPAVDEPEVGAPLTSGGLDAAPSTPAVGTFEPEPEPEPAYDPFVGWDDEDMAKLAHQELRERIRALAPGAVERIRVATPSWPMNAKDYGAVDDLVTFEEEAAILPEAPSSSSVGPDEAPPAGLADAAIGPSGPTGSFADRPVEWLKAEVDRLSLPADRRSRQSMVDALEAHEAGRPSPDLFGDDPF